MEIQESMAQTRRVLNAAVAAGQPVGELPTLLNSAVRLETHLGLLRHDPDLCVVTAALPDARLRTRKVVRCSCADPDHRRAELCRTASDRSGRAVRRLDAEAQALAAWQAFYRITGMPDD